MVLLIDTNVLIDYLGRREKLYDDARSVLKFCTLPEIQGYVAFHSLPNIWYVLRKEPQEQRRNGLIEVCSILKVTGANHSEIMKALRQSDFKDFEDCLQDRCAVTVHADYIITRNVKDYRFAETKVLTPSEFVKRFVGQILPNP